MSDLLAVTTRTWPVWIFLEVFIWGAFGFVLWLLFGPWVALPIALGGFILCTWMLWLDWRNGGYR